jgi:hypothetical protein
MQKIKGSDHFLQDFENKMQENIIALIVATIKDCLVTVLK